MLLNRIVRRCLFKLPPMSGPARIAETCVPGHRAAGSGSTVSPSADQRASSEQAVPRHYKAPSTPLLSRPSNVSTMSIDTPELTRLETLPTEILHAVVDLLPLWEIKRLSCASKRLRQACLSILFLRVKFEFSQAGIEGLKDLLK